MVLVSCHGEIVQHYHKQTHKQTNRQTHKQAGCVSYDVCLLTHILHHPGRLHPASHSVHSCSHPEIVQTLVLLPDSILRIDPSSFHIPLLQRLEWEGGGGGGGGGEGGRGDTDTTLGERDTDLILACWTFCSFSAFLAALSSCLVEN